MEPVTRELLPYRDERECLLVAPYHERHRLTAQATALSRGGSIEIIKAGITWNAAKQRWEIPVRWLRNASPWPRRLTIAGSVFGFLAIIGWVLSSLARESLLVLCLAALAGLWLLVRAGRRPSVSVTQITQVTVRR